jgi:hypothetical protein
MEIDDLGALEVAVDAADGSAGDAASLCSCSIEIAEP